MAKTKFIYNGIETTFDCKLEDKMEDICNTFARKVGVDVNKVYFLYGGLQINLNLKYKEIIQNGNELNILVYNRNTYIKNNNNKLIKSKEVICPKCGEICMDAIQV